jgi:hypothetical protein
MNVGFSPCGSALPNQTIAEQQLNTLRQQQLQEAERK